MEVRNKYAKEPPPSLVGEVQKEFSCGTANNNFVFSKNRKETMMGLT